MDTAAAAMPRASRTPVYALLGASAISAMGDQVTRLAIPWFVLVTTGSAAKTGTVAFFTLLPVVLATFFGGAIVDRFGFRRMSVTSDILSGVTVAMIPLTYHTVGLNFSGLLVLVFLSGLLDAPGATARQAMLPELVEAAGMKLERANAASQTIFGLSSLFGPPLAGVLIVALGATDALWVNAATFAVSAAIVAAAVPVTTTAAKPHDRYLAEVMEGLRYLLNERVLCSIALTSLIVNFIIAPLFIVVMPVYANRLFGSASDLGLVLSGFGAGTLAGSILFGVIGPRLPRWPTFIGTLFILGLPIWVLATLPSVPLAFVALAAIGLGAGLINPLGMTIFQERSPVELRGRILGTIMASATVATPVGVLLAGVLIETIGLRPLILGIAAVFLLVTVSTLLNPALRNLDAPDADMLSTSPDGS